MARPLKLEVIRTEQPTRLGSVNSFMYAANDPQGHTIRHSTIAGGWMLESPWRGLIRTHRTFIGALSDLERVSCKSADLFSVTEQP